MSEPGARSPKEEAAMRFVPSFCDFNSNVSNGPMPIRVHDDDEAKRASSPSAGPAPAHRPSSSPAAMRVDLAGEAVEEGKAAGPRSPAMVFAESLYENMRQT